VRRQRGRHYEEGEGERHEGDRCEPDQDIQSWALAALVIGDDTRPRGTPGPQALEDVFYD
jgi:hypothetical protein